MKSKSWLEFIRELNRNAVLVRRMCSQSKSRFTRVVFPVPTSPVSVMNPLRACIPYISPDSASSICLVRNRNRGSGLTLNGFSFSPKKLLYIFVWSSPPTLSYPFLRCLFSRRYRKTSGRECQLNPSETWCVVNLYPPTLFVVSRYAVYPSKKLASRPSGLPIDPPANTLLKLGFARPGAVSAFRLRENPPCMSPLQTRVKLLLAEPVT